MRNVNKNSLDIFWSRTLFFHIFVLESRAKEFEKKFSEAFDYLRFQGNFFEYCSLTYGYVNILILYPIMEDSQEIYTKKYTERA